MLSIHLSKLFRTVLDSDPGQWDGMWQRPCGIQSHFTPGTSGKPGRGKGLYFFQEGVRVEGMRSVRHCFSLTWALRAFGT